MRIKGIHKVKARLKSGAHYRYYAWRGGPCFWVSETPVKEPAPLDFKRAFEEATRGKGRGERGRLSGLIDDFKTDAKYQGLKRITRRDYERSLAVIVKKFGKAQLEVFEDRRMRQDIKAWHQSFAARPRQADMHLGMLVRLLNFGVDQGVLDKHCASGIDRLHQADRAAIIWEPAEIEALLASATEHVRLALRIAALSGLRRTDLVSMPVNADKGDHINFWTSKSNKRTEVVIPVYPALRAALDAMSAYRKGFATNCLAFVCNSRGRPWTPDGFSTAFQKARDDIECSKHFHDLRGTAVTNFCATGFADDEIAEFVGWQAKDVRAIRRRYVSRKAIVSAAVARLERNQSGTKL